VEQHFSALDALNKQIHAGVLLRCPVCTGTRDLQYRSGESTQASTSLLHFLLTCRCGFIVSERIPYLDLLMCKGPLDVAMLVSQALANAQLALLPLVAGTSKASDLAKKRKEEAPW
jgi:hypothetical protein